MNAHLSANSRLFQQTAAAVDQMIQGARIFARTPPNKIMVTYNNDEAVAYRHGIQLFAEAFDSLSE
jgi:soluble cytochrome b562